MSRTLTSTQALGIAKILDSTGIGAKVTILPGAGREQRISGTLRHLAVCSGSAAYPSAGMDVRDAYVRITTVQGFETWLPMQELVDAYLDGDVYFGIASTD